MKRIIEVRAAEGGDDSSLFTQDLANAYLKLALKLGWTTRLVSSRLGEIKIEVTGDNLHTLEQECGGHRIQRIPPTEKRGRVQTSTVTVAVIDPEMQILRTQIQDSDLKIEWYSGTGAGGQHRNKHQNSCRITYMPTGLVVTSQCRSRINSLESAKDEIVSRVNALHLSKATSETSNARKIQVGSGMRGDKVRTYRFQDDSVKDHLTNKTSSVKTILKGNFDLLWR